jgi:hypothetical protein
MGIKKELLTWAMVLLELSVCLSRAGGAGGPIRAMGDRSMGSAPVWRFWSPTDLRHFYTISASERDKLLDRYAEVWTYEGVSYRAFGTAVEPQLAPVYRFWSAPLRAHFYTLSEREKDKLINRYSHIWTYEGIAFYAYAAGWQAAATLPVYRFWSGSLRTHFYTASETERYKLISGYPDVWTYEGVAWYAYPAQSASSVSLVKGPYLQGPRSDSITVMWETDVPADSRVDYGMATPDELSVADADLCTLHKMVLSGLAADTTYVYQVASSGTAGPIGAFTMAPATARSFRFAVYGDSRTYPTAHAEVARSVANSGPEILLHVGDIVGLGRDYHAWGAEFFEPGQDLLLSTPIVPALGNHEYAGTGPLWFFYFFDRPYGEGWFAMTYGNTRFVGLDTTVSYAVGSKQHDWLLAELTSAEYNDATWHIVFFHYPPFSATTGHLDDPTVQSRLVPLLEQYGVDIAFQGHSHAYERYLHNGIYYIVTGGGGGPLHELALDITPPIRQYGRSVHHHCVVDVDVGARVLTVMAVDNDGRVFDQIELRRTP